MRTKDKFRGNIILRAIGYIERGSCTVVIEQEILKLPVAEKHHGFGEAVLQTVA